MTNFPKTIFKLTLIVFAVFTLSSAAYADDVVDYINEALDYYKNGQYSDAIDSLNFAETMIQQKKSAGLEVFLPDPLKGWKADAPTSQAASSAMLGGGITAERQYNKGSSSIQIQIIADSPMMQSVMMMMSNPMFATSDGGKMERIKGQKAIVKYDPTSKDGDIQIVVANRFLVTIDGDDVTNKDLKDYAKAIDYKKLSTLP